MNIREKIITSKYSNISQNLNSLKTSIRLHRTTDESTKARNALFLLILIIGITIYFIKKIFSFLSWFLFLKNTPYSGPKPDDIKFNPYNNYTFNYSFNSNQKLNDSEYILDKKKYQPYFSKFHLNKFSQKKNSELNKIYEIFKFSEKGESSSILVDYSSSLPRFPSYAEKNQKCFKRGEIITKIENIKKLKCIDISGILYEDKNFFIRFSLINKNFNEIELFIFKEINIDKEFNNLGGKHNLLFYETNESKINLRFCSNELSLIGEKYASLPREYIPIIEISWPYKNQYFCVKDIRLFYNN